MVLLTGQLNSSHVGQSQLDGSGQNFTRRKKVPPRQQCRQQHTGDASDKATVDSLGKKRRHDGSEGRSIRMINRLLPLLCSLVAGQLSQEDLSLADLVSEAWRRFLTVNEHRPTELLYMAKKRALLHSELIHSRKLALRPVARFDVLDRFQQNTAVIRHRYMYSVTNLVGSPLTVSKPLMSLSQSTSVNEVIVLPL